jgi:hypothetical protein
VADANFFQNLINKTQGISKEITEGIRKSVAASKYAYAEKERTPSILKLRGPYHESLKQQGVSLTGTPIQAASAAATRLVTDITNDATRGIYWRYNHPLAILEQGIQKTIGQKRYEELGPTKAGLIGAAIALPTTALAGTYNLLNPGEMFRPEGFTQRYSEQGSEDRRETSQPVPELFERFFLGRQGEPLKYETAKQEIPDLTPERYSNFMRSYYQDKGVLGLVKATPENLQGVPEVRMLGYPVTIPSASAAVGGIVGAAAALRTAPVKQVGLRRGLVGAGGGALAGAVIGSLVNEQIAAANRPTLPTVAEYTQGMQ